MSLFDQRSMSVISHLSDLSDLKEQKSGPYLEGNIKLLDAM